MYNIIVNTFYIGENYFYSHSKNTVSSPSNSRCRYNQITITIALIILARASLRFSGRTPLLRPKNPAAKILALQEVAEGQFNIFELICIFFVLAL